MSRKPTFSLQAVLLVLLLGLGGRPAYAMVCDVDGDGDVDRNDITLIAAARNTPATGPEDPRDPDGDGMITVLDARKCVLRCSLPGCPGNSPPVANAGPDQTVRVGSTVGLNGSGSTDPDGNLLSFEWSFTSKPAGSAAALDNPATVTPSFLVDVAGTYVVQLVVKDGITSSAPDIVQISTANSRPIANAGPDQTTFVTRTAQLDGSGSSDADGDPLTYAWSFVARPEGSAAELQNPSTVKPTFFVDRPGSYVVELVVGDGSLTSVPDEVVITTENSAPVAKAGPDQTAFVGTTVQLSGAASSDVDGNPLTCLWSFTSRPDGSSAALSDAAVVSPSFTLDVFGAYVVQLIVNDGRVDSAPDTVTISTLNSAPIADAGPDQEDVAVWARVQLDGSGSSDVDGNPLRYAWAFLSRPEGSAATLFDPTAENPTFVADVAGTYVVQLIVNDGTVDSAADTVVVMAAVPPQADILLEMGVNNSAPFVGATVTFTLIVSNLGPAFASAIEITDKLPSGFESASGAPDQGTYDPVAGVWNVGSLSAGASLRMLLTGTVKATGDFTNTATVTVSTPADPNPGNNAAAISVTPRQ